MSLEDRLSEVYERGASDGSASLSADDLTRYLAWDCILHLEAGGLSGYFHDVLPDLDAVRTAIAALEGVGLNDLARLMERAGSLFAGYDPAGPARTWEDVLRLHDPDGALDRLQERIHALDNYGVGP